VVLFFPVYVWQNFAFEKESGCRHSESDLVRIKCWLCHFNSIVVLV